MIRFLGFSTLCVLLAGCNTNAPYQSVISGPYATVKMSLTDGEMGVIVFEPDANCKMNFAGRARFKAYETPPVWKMPPGRAYFRTSVWFGNTYLGLEDVSFVLEESQEYTIEFKKLGTSAGWTGQKIEYEYNYLDTSGEFPAPVVTDHFEVCGREPR
ncbi:MAG: hypothetical protein ACR2PZ_02465 [Pseudomonadales bacterium]